MDIEVVSLHYIKYTTSVPYTEIKIFFRVNQSNRVQVTVQIAMAENTCTKVEEETQQVTDSSQGRVVTSNGKLRPMSTLSSESGYHEGMQQVDSANKDQLLYIQVSSPTTAIQYSVIQECYCKTDL